MHEPIAQNETHPVRTWGFLCLLVTALAGAAIGETFTKEDSGWVPLFNGKNYDGLYSRMYNQPVSTTIDAGFKIQYAGTDSAEISVGQVGGELGTQRISYSHYRMRVQYRFEAAGNLNAGFLYAIDETYPRMGGDGTTAKGNWPRSIECQMLQGDGGDAFSIQQVTFDTKVTNSRWDPNGKAIKVCEFGCDGRSFGASTDKADYPGPRWNDQEVVVRGADTAIHIMNGLEVFKLWNIRITNNSGVTQKPWPSGAVGLEAENAKVHYRRWEIMELPETGPNFLNRLFVTSPNQGVNLNAGTSAPITWKTLGDVAKVSVYYDLGNGGGWTLAADNINNTGTYAWPVPSQASTKLRVKVMAAAAWVQADSSDGNNAIIVGTGLARQDKLLGGKSGLEVTETNQARDLKGRSMGTKLLKAIRSIHFLTP